MRAYLRQAYGTRDQPAHGSGITISHVAPLMRLRLLLSTNGGVSSLAVPAQAGIHNPSVRDECAVGCAGMTKEFLFINIKFFES
jgi:hypothetical protein